MRGGRSEVFHDHTLITSSPDDLERSSPSLWAGGISKIVLRKQTGGIESFGVLTEPTV